MSQTGKELDAGRAGASILPGKHVIGTRLYAIGMAPDGWHARLEELL
jgi:hypothetical protein